MLTDRQIDGIDNLCMC